MSNSIVNYTLNKVQNNQKCLFVWSGKNVPEEFQSSIERLQEKIGQNNKISLEHFDRLAIANYPQSTFDCILSNILASDSESINNAATLANYLKLLKQNGFLIAIGADLETELKLNGFKDVTKESLDAKTVFCAVKPNFEVGSVSKLKFAKSSTIEKTVETAKVWKFTQDDMQEDDLIDTDALLDDLDLKKTVNLDKFDCGTSSTGKASYFIEH